MSFSHAFVELQQISLMSDQDRILFYPILLADDKNSETESSVFLFFQKFHNEKSFF